METAEIARPTFLDRAKFFAVAGVGFFADGYLNLTISLVVPTLGYIYWRDEGYAMPTIKASVIKGCLNVGLVLGQLTFGFLGDTFGRKKVYGKELLVTIFGTLMCILLPWKGLPHDGIVAWMAVWRLVTGFGVGGDFPMSTVLAAESTVFGTRSKVIGVIRLFNASGTAVAYTIFLILLAAFKNRIEDDLDNLQYVWRLMMGIGIIPCALTVYGRLTMKETDAYVKYVKTDTQENIEAKESRTTGQQWRDFATYFSDWRHAAALFAVSISWMLNNICAYGVSFNQSDILASIGFVTGKTPYTRLWNIAVGNLVAQACGYLPGYIPAIWYPGWFGRTKPQFVFSFLSMVIFAVWAGVVKTASTGGSLALLIIGQFIIDGLLSATIFLLPIELFPTRIRATGYGIASASGQIGAILTAFAFGTAALAMGLNGMFGLFAGFYVIIFCVTSLIPETKNATISELESDAIFVKKWGTRRRGTHEEDPSTEEEDAAAVTMVVAPDKSVEV